MASSVAKGQTFGALSAQAPRTFVKLPKKLRTRSSEKAVPSHVLGSAHGSLVGLLCPCRNLAVQSRSVREIQPAVAQAAPVSSGNGHAAGGVWTSSVDLAPGLPAAEESPSTGDPWASPGGAASLVIGRRTGGAIGFRGATESLVKQPLTGEKLVVLVRHGLSSWNEEGRVQGSSDESVLSPQGIAQALKCKEALRFVDFDCCFASPISRAKTSAELIWQGREGPLVFLDSLKEAHLLFLEGMLNSEAKAQYPEEFGAWRDDPINFRVNGVYPVRDLWEQANKAWEQVLTAEGNTVLVVTHKSILRALLCTALGMGPERFRAIDVNNGGVCVLRVSKEGEPMLESLNLASHLQCEGVHYNF